MKNTFRALAFASATLCLALDPHAAPQDSSEGSPAPSASSRRKGEHVYPKMGSIERIDPALDRLLSSGVQIEKLASGFRWSEGPVWDKKSGSLLFCDVPNNVVFRWREGVGTREFLFPSGYAGNDPRFKEGGANGLAFDRSGYLVLCQHGNRQVARLGSDGKFKPLARYYNFQRFNSPNDIVFKSNGDFYFTDPPYGLPKGNDDSAKELNFSGVFRVTPRGDVTLLTSELTFPNGLAFSPDEKILYIAVSDPKAPRLMAYDVTTEGKLENGRIFFDAAPLAAKGGKGLPDGLKVDQHGNVWSTGPGGVLIISPEGVHLGTINTGEPTGNCVFGGKGGSTLYITANTILCRIQTLTKGAEF